MVDGMRDILVSLDKILGSSSIEKEQIERWLQQHTEMSVEGYQLKIYRKTDNEWDIQLEWNNDGYGNKFHRQFTAGECRIEDAAVILNLTSEYQLYAEPYFLEADMTSKIFKLSELQEAFKKHCVPNQIDL